MKAKRQTRRDARKLFRFCVENGQLVVERVREVTRGIVASRRRGYVALLWEFHRLVKLECARHTAEVGSAVPLEEDLRRGIAADLERLYGIGLDVRFVNRPELIGGLRVLVGSDVYDDSVCYRLIELQRSFSSAGGSWRTGKQ